MSSIRVTKTLPDVEEKEAAREFEQLVRRELELIGEDPEREGLLATPRRVARAMTWLTQGYNHTAKEVIGNGVFKEEHDNMRSEEHTSELQSLAYLVCRLL